VSGQQHNSPPLAGASRAQQHNVREPMNNKLGGNRLRREITFAAGGLIAIGCQPAAAPPIAPAARVASASPFVPPVTSKPSPLNRDKVLAIARQAVKENDTWIDRAKFGEPSQNPDGSWNVLVERIPRQSGGWRSLTIGADGKLKDYFRGL
jgi:hypothetical protein